MSKEQWGHGFHTGQREGLEQLIDEIALSSNEDFEHSRMIKRLHALLILLSEYEVGENGHDSYVYLGLLSSIEITNKVLKSIQEKGNGKVLTINKRR